ncbi:MAG: YihY family inner membrane protein [Pseudomonadota bacterium]|nr:YihY family inner membrane protein [Pseudomonadota bacterium]
MTPAPDVRKPPTVPFGPVFKRLQSWPWLGTFVTLVRRFREDRLALTASSLTFTSVISLVPLATVMLALFSAFPMFSTLQDSLQHRLVDSLVPDTIARPVLGAITQFSSRASRLGIFGLVALVISAIALMLTIDRALNAIWRVRKPRPIGQRVLVYWSAVTLGPLLLGVSLTATSYALSTSAGYLGPMPHGLGVAFGLAEFVVVSLGITALFHYVPNTHVRWRHALAGGLFVAIGFALAKRLLALYFRTVPTYSLIYGAFATVPIFLVWIYLSWIIVLLGAVLAAYAPVAGMQVARWPVAAGSRFHLALVIVRTVRDAKGKGRNGMSASELSKALGTDPLQIEPLLDALVEIDWIGKLVEQGNPRYVLLCDPANVLAEPLLAKLLLDPAPDLSPFWDEARFAELRLAQILRD